MRPSAGLGWFGLLLGPTTGGRLWLPGSSGHQLRWLARQVCSVVFGGVRGTCVLSNVWRPGLLLRHTGLLCSGVHWPELEVTPTWCHQRGSPLAMISILRSSCRWMLSMFKFMSRVFVVTRAGNDVVTRAPASRQTLAAFLSGTPRDRSTPAWAQAERWSVKGSRSSWRKLWWDDWAACICHP